MAKRKFTQSVRDAVKWYRLWGTVPVWSWVNAAANFKQQDFQTAAALYRKGIKRHSKHPAIQSAKLDLAYCLYRLDSFDEANLQLDEIISESTVLRDAYLLRARISLILGSCSSALRVLNLALKKFPQDARVMTQYAHVALLHPLEEELANEIKERLVALKCRLSLEDPENVLIDTALAQYEMTWGEIRRGERVLARVLATGKAPFEAVLLRGERLLSQGRILPARELLTRAMRMSTRDPRPLMRLSASYLETGISANFDWALQLAEQSCRLSHWQHPECLNVLASVHEAKGDSARAQLYFERTKHVPAAIEPQFVSRLSLRDSFSQKVSNS